MNEPSSSFDNICELLSRMLDSHYLASTTIQLKIVKRLHLESYKTKVLDKAVEFLGGVSLARASIRRICDHFLYETCMKPIIFAF